MRGEAARSTFADFETLRQGFDPANIPINKGDEPLSLQQRDVAPSSWHWP